MAVSPDSDRWSYVARFGWSGVLKPVVALVLVIALVVWTLLRDSLSWGDYLGEFGLLLLFVVVLNATAGPSLRRAPAVAVSAAGVLVGGRGMLLARSSLIAWSEVAGVRLYRFTTIDSMSESTSILSYSYLHVDVHHGPPIRTRVESAKIDADALRCAVVGFAPHIPVVDEGVLERDPLCRPDMELMLEAEMNLLNRLRGRRGHPPIRRYSPPASPQGDSRHDSSSAP